VVDTSKDEGRIEGIIEGKKEGKKEIARKIKKAGIDVETIMKFTKLNKEEIGSL
jgi:predicted transposase/invertase (TIGR01784 family)